MFTGLVEAVGHVESLTQQGHQAQLTVSLPFAPEMALGDSLAVNGCCLTVVTRSQHSVTFDLLKQTLEITALGTLKHGDPVNLERALRVGDRLGGHFLQGHIDGLGTMLECTPVGQDHRLVVRLPETLLPYCLDKGSIALDGISLTIAELDDSASTVTCWITPHTFSHTNLPARNPGALIHLEADLLAKFLLRQQQRTPKNLTTPPPHLTPPPPHGPTSPPS